MTPTQTSGAPEEFENAPLTPNIGQSLEGGILLAVGGGGTALGTSLSARVELERDPDGSDGLGRPEAGAAVTSLRIGPSGRIFMRHVHTMKSWRMSGHWLGVKRNYA